jgi:flagellin-like hook-associated protein FlgL
MLTSEKHKNEKAFAASKPMDDNSTAAASDTFVGTLKQYLQQKTILEVAAGSLFSNRS